MSLIAILGATGTIGSVLARRLVRQGHDVLLVGRNEVKLRSLSEELGQPFVAVDLTSSQTLDDALRAMADAQGGFHAFVNCIGSILLKPAHTTTDDEFRQVVETNLFATVRVGARLLREPFPFQPCDRPRCDNRFEDARINPARHGRHRLALLEITPPAADA